MTDISYDQYISSHEAEERLFNQFDCNETVEINLYMVSENFGPKTDPNIANAVRKLTNVKIKK